MSPARLRCRRCGAGLNVGELACPACGYFPETVLDRLGARRSVLVLVVALGVLVTGASIYRIRNAPPEPPVAVTSVTGNDEEDDDTAVDDEDENPDPADDERKRSGEIGHGEGGRWYGVIGLIALGIFLVWVVAVGWPRKSRGGEDPP